MIEQAVKWLWSVMIVLLLVEQGQGEDVVRLLSGQIVKGQIVERTGQRLEINGVGGVKRSIPADQVAEVTSLWQAEHRAADDLFAAAKFAEALARYQQAVQKEERRWARRMILAQMIRAATNLGQYRTAGEYFLLLVRDDPQTRDFDAIPLAWLPGEPAAEMSTTAQQWLARDEPPVAVLIGASQLLLVNASTAETSTKLQRLTTNADTRIAALAEAQLWRVSIANATPEQLARWAERVEQFPERLRAGPYYVLGRAQAFRQQREQAALSYLHVPILFPSQRPLAAESLLAAAGELKSLGQNGEAVRLWSELVQNYPETRAAKEGQQRLHDERPPTPR